jgi:hypothetical protein
MAIQKDVSAKYAGAIVEIIIVPVGEIGWQGDTINCVSSQPSQSGTIRFGRWCVDLLDLDDKSLVHRQVKGLVRDDDLAVEMRADRHVRVSAFIIPEGSSIQQFIRCAWQGTRRLRF